MNQIYLVKRLEFKHGASLNPHVPYTAELDTDRDLWLIHLNNDSPYLPVLSKFVEKVVDTDLVLV